MHPLQLLAILLGLAVTAVGIALLTRAVMRIVAVVRQGRATIGRFDDPGQRTVTMLREVFLHPRMLRKKWVAVAHWFTMISFGVLFLTLVTAYGQLFNPHFALPLIGHFPPFEWLTEFFGWTGLFGIVFLMVLRQKIKPSAVAREKGDERRSRFWGSTFWQAYYVEFTILGVVLCILALRALEYALGHTEGSEHASALHFPLTAWMGSALTGLSAGTLGALIITVALVKILISMAWMITIGLQPTMGVAWHRFLAFFNIWFKRHADGRTSLGELQPMMVGGKPLTSMEQLEEIAEAEEGEGDDELRMGVGAIEDFTWKGLLDFTTCTECGRCQEQCPAWNTEKPLSPKMLVMNLRDAAYAQAPWQTATSPAAVGVVTEQDGGSGAHPAGDTLTESPEDFDIRQLVGPTEGDPTIPSGGAVIDPDVLWSCTSCGACVEQCPVDIEHVDAIVDMRRNQVLIESAFPSELGGLFKNLESKQNPWGMANSTRMDWAKDLDFPIKQVGQDVESLSEVEYLFWVGCAGAFEDRAKKTTQAVAELLNIAGVDFAVLGDGEACTGDSARRAGNEVLYQMLAQQNVEMLNEVGATKIVVSCAHCFNTIKNEYPQNGGKYEVVHHTQLLNRLVREKKLQPVAASEVESPSKVASSAPSVTYHDPCYLGRHNKVYEAPRELIATLPGVEYREMERSKEKSFCCGAGGARMWMEEKLGSRINVNRTEEAIGTGAERIAIGCPFCRVMMSDGLTAAQEEGRGKDVEVVDVAQMLLAGVRRGQQGEESRLDPATAREGAPAQAPAEGTAVDEAVTQRIVLPGSADGLDQQGSTAAGDGSDLPTGDDTSSAADRGAGMADRTSDGDDAEGSAGTSVDESDTAAEAAPTVDKEGATGQTGQPAKAAAGGAAGAATGAAAGAVAAGTAPAAFTGQRIGADTPTRFGWAGGDASVAAQAGTAAPVGQPAADTSTGTGAETAQPTPETTGTTATAPSDDAGAAAPAANSGAPGQGAAAGAAVAGIGSGTAPGAFAGQRIGADTPTRFGWASGQGAPASASAPAAAPATAAPTQTTTPAKGTDAPADRSADAGASAGAAHAPGAPSSDGAPSETAGGTAPADSAAAAAGVVPGVGSGTAPSAFTGQRISADAPIRFGWASGQGAPASAPATSGSETEAPAPSAPVAAPKAEAPAKAAPTEPTDASTVGGTTDAAAGEAPAASPQPAAGDGASATAPAGHSGTQIGSDAPTRFGWAQGQAAPVESTGVMTGSAVAESGIEQQPTDTADASSMEVVEEPAAVAAGEPVDAQAADPTQAAEARDEAPAAPAAPQPTGGPVDVPNVGERAPRIGSGSPALRLGAWKG
ncbi:heterodisulfide reductase-related iron-sulfur binding cluster [Kytococcus sp. Marseille-QA3725]